jgi:uncharacterized membrane protein YfcA
MTPLFIDIALFISTIIAGVLTGVIGVGGGIILLPLLTYLNFSIQQAVAITLFLNAIPDTLPALYLYYKEGYFLVKPSIIATFGIIIGVIIGGYIGSKKMISDKTLYRIYTAILVWITIYMFIYYC